MYKTIKYRSLPIICGLLWWAIGCGISTSPEGQPKQNASAPHTGHKTHKTGPETHPAIEGDTLHLEALPSLLAALKLDTAKQKSISQFDNLVGIAAVDQEAITVVSARVKGRIEKLFVRNPGIAVMKGQALYQIYSEELLIYINEYRFALQQLANVAPTSQLVSRRIQEGAKRKLLLWGLTEYQVHQIASTDTPPAVITYYSPASGYLINLQVKEGQYVEIGSPLFTMADLQTLWIETQLYSNEVQYMDQQPKVTLHFEASPSRIYVGKLVFNNPKLEENQKINLARFRIVNTDLKIKPGMMAYVNFNRNGRRALVIPKSSLVIGTMTVAWVKTGEGMFERRMLQTGIENKQEVEVVKGIHDGEIVVTSGGYLLSGELTLRQGGLKGHSHSQ